MKVVRGLLIFLGFAVLVWVLIAFIITRYTEISTGGHVIGYLGTLAIIIILLKRAYDNRDTAAVTKAVTNAELNEEEFGKLISMTEIKGYKYKTSSVKRTYLFFGNYVYTIKFTKV